MISQHWFTGLPHVREKSGEIFFSRSGNCQGISQIVGKFWTGANVREMSGNFMVGFFKSIFYHNFHTWNHLALQFWTELLIIMITSRVFNGPDIMERSLNLTNAIPGLKNLEVLSFCHKFIEKSGDSSSEHFSEIYSFEARLTTNASVHHFLSFLQFLNINILDHTLCWFFYFTFAQRVVHHWLSLHFCHPCDFDNSTSLSNKSTVVTGQL